MVGRAKSSPISFTRAGVSLPCNCMRSGARASTMRLSVSSSASTLSATIFARPRACRPERARGRPVDMARAFGEKHEPDHVRAGVERGVERGGRGKAADFDNGRHGALLSIKAPALSKDNRASGARRPPVKEPAKRPSRRMIQASARPRRWSVLRGRRSAGCRRRPRRPRRPARSAARRDSDRLHGRAGEKLADLFHPRRRFAAHAIAGGLALGRRRCAGTFRRLRRR